MKILIAGGAGFIGSNLCVDNGFSPPGQSKQHSCQAI